MSRVASVSEPFTCIPCDSDFNSFDELEKHKIDSPKHHYCSMLVCRRDFDSYQELYRHKRQAHGAKPKHLTCTGCKQTFPTDVEYVDHRVRFHYCRPCKKEFDHAPVLRKHNREHHRSCPFPTCSEAIFESEDELQDHWRYSEAHFWCEECEFHLPDGPSLRKHKKDEHNLSHCYTCKDDFDTEQALKEHFVQSLDHAFCQYCVKHFPSKNALRDHFVNDHFYCIPCKEVFKNDYGLQEHYRQSEAHHYCEVCKEQFSSANNLQNHSRSHSAKIYSCPFTGCTQRFASQSAVILHLEAGYCKSGVDRATVNREVRRLDKDNIITDPSRLLTSSNDSVTIFRATEYSWNGTAYECYLCHRDFAKLYGLNQHLSSPKHLEKVYICPLQTCGTRFSTLSGLWQHVESEKCGISRFERVKTAMDNIVGRMGSLTM